MEGRNFHRHWTTTTTTTTTQQWSPQNLNIPTSYWPVTLADLVVLAYVLLDRSICLCRHLLSDYRTAAAAPPGPQIDTKHTPVVVVGWMDGQ